MNASYYGSSGHTSPLTSPQGAYTDMFTLPRTCRCTETHGDASRRGSLSLGPRATAEPLREATESSASLFSCQLFLNELWPRVYFFMNESPSSE